MKVKFNYDPGDRSVGIYGGWEDCYVTTGDDDALEAIVFFQPLDSASIGVADWPVLNTQVRYNRSEDERSKSDKFTTWKVLADKEYADLDAENFDDAPTLGEYADLCEAVEKVWAAMQARERLEDQNMAVAGIEQEIDELTFDVDFDSLPADKKASIRSMQEQAEHERQSLKELEAEVRDIFKAAAELEAE